MLVHEGVVGETGAEGKPARERRTIRAKVGMESSLQDMVRPNNWIVSPWMPTDALAHNTGIFVRAERVSSDLPSCPSPLENVSEVCFDKKSQHVLLPLTLTQVCPILIVVGYSGKTVNLTLRYRRSFLSSEQAQILRNSIRHVISSALKSPNTLAREVSLSEDSCQQHRIKAWNSQSVPSSPYTSIHQFIRQHAHSRPDKQAVHAWNGSLTFSQLDAMSDLLADHLCALHVGVGASVLVCFEKSMWAVVAMLAINKTGAFFVPLEPSLPPGRLENIAAQTRADMIIISDQQTLILKGLVSNRVIVSEQTMASLRSATAYMPERSAARADDPAYCLFTSGSTGQPKGCLVSHGALASVFNHCGPLRIGVDSRVLQLASFSFGISLIEIWCTLVAGGTICMPSGEDRQNRLPDVINEMGVNWALMTPTTIQVLSPGHVPNLRTVAIAGEPLTRSQLETWADAVYLFQAYGLTEWAGICGVSAQVCSGGSNTNIGTSAGGRFWLVSPSDHNKLAPIGAEAELLIEGPSLALGYLDQPDQTAERFISSPPWMASVSDDASLTKRLYKTGDLVCYNPDGSVAFLSRKGTLAKLRGQRIELGEVEHHIAAVAGNLEKVVAEIVVPLGEDGSPALAAFVLAHQQAQVGRSDSQEAGDSWLVAANDEL